MSNQQEMPDYDDYELIDHQEEAKASSAAAADKG